MMTSKEGIELIRSKNGFICDMDGVLYHGNRILPGVIEFIDWLKQENKKYIFLTNSSERTPEELHEKLKRMGIEVDKSHFYTSALATATFLAGQKPHGSAYIIGDAGLSNALYNVGYTMNNVNPDYVVVGESRSYSYERIELAVRLVLQGAKLIGTNSDVTGPAESGLVPATKALVAPIELSTGKKAYYIGKPNPLMMRIALEKLGTTPEETIIIGDRMDTDIVAGIESGIQTLLVLSGITDLVTMKSFAYIPHFVLKGVIDLITK